ncbi:MAG: biotin/acetyl-CoA-carboxylase ligase [Ignavibacteria bacterium]|nr:MAG: biotin/acetyl-CoA-carboxylase ligase [Ignavibacteria bacterium]KAF0160905.1 MAG: biotin/acetyl-CoA-carboxylase ligase [Ignavibacteria bacterium]
MFNIEEFDIKLDTEIIGRSFIYCDEVDSTNSMLLNSREFNTHGTVILAEHQKHGRGRKNREWYSNSGQNLTFSILLKGEFNQEQVNLINLGAAISVAQALENLFQLDVELKWPNDVLIHKKKICGILLESTSKGDKLNRIVIGIGINVNQPNFPGKFDIPPTSVRKEFHVEVSREKLLSEILNNFETAIGLSENKPQKILDNWRTRCKMIGEKVKVVEEANSRFGVFVDIDTDGFMILKVGDEIVKVHYGDVSLR